MSPPERSVLPSEGLEDVGCGWGPNSRISVSGPGTNVIFLVQGDSRRFGSLD
jgi:hypothetical protein